MPARPSTARAKLVATLADEILSKPEKTAFPIASEHELCRRFDLSRVTVRLALSDLENRGLIYRRHGKGTFAHGCAGRIHRNIGILMQPSATENRDMAELVRGVQSVQVEIGAGVMLISVSPEEWRAEMASALSGIIVIPAGVTAKDLSVLRDRNLPFLIWGDSDLTGPRVVFDQSDAATPSAPELHAFFAAGRAAAQALNGAAQTGADVADLLMERASIGEPGGLS